MNTNSIRALQAEKVRLLQDAHRKMAEIDTQIEAIRAGRGTKIKAIVDGNWYEVGRDRDRSHPHGTP
jgi:hypothetical protein